jgi:L-lysine exporter family protein LysE/ArgO
LYFIWGKIKNFRENLEIPEQKQKSKSIVIAQTLGFTFLNPHVYSDTVFMLGNLSKSFQFFHQKIAFGLGASLASILFFYSIGYGSYFLRSFFLNKKIWNITNVIIIIYLLGLVFYLAFNEIFKFI